MRRAYTYHLGMEVEVSDIKSCVRYRNCVCVCVCVLPLLSCSKSEAFAFFLEQQASREVRRCYLPLQQALWMADRRRAVMQRDRRLGCTVEQKGDSGRPAWV